MHILWHQRSWIATPLALPTLGICTIIKFIIILLFSVFSIFGHPIQNIHSPYFWRGTKLQIFLVHNRLQWIQKKIRSVFIKPVLGFESLSPFPRYSYKYKFYVPSNPLFTSTTWFWGHGMKTALPFHIFYKHELPFEYCIVSFFHSHTNEGSPHQTHFGSWIQAPHVSFRLHGSRFLTPSDVTLRSATRIMNLKE